MINQDDMISGQEIQKAKLKIPRSVLKQYRILKDGILCNVQGDEGMEKMDCIANNMHANMKRIERKGE